MSDPYEADRYILKRIAVAFVLWIVGVASLAVYRTEIFNFLKEILQCK